MKKIFVIIGICMVLITMPSLTAFQISGESLVISKAPSKLVLPSTDDWDGTFIGGIGRLYKLGGEWQFDLQAGLAGNYRGGSLKKIYGFIYNLDEVQIGYITAYFIHRVIIGFIENMDGQRAPLIGFLYWNNNTFAGRIMSVFGPAPHIIGEYRPNK